jgi:spermidine synthase
LSAPVTAALALVVATALYPLAFPWLASFNLIAASFLGGTLLLGLPLVVLSAMNPLLIALERRPPAEGDSGAGRVFFISTMGSVAGVLVTAFVLIPNLTNFRALIFMSAGLCCLAGGLSYLNREIPGRRQRRLLLTCLLGLLLAAALLAGQRSYFQLLAHMSGLGKETRLLAEYTSVFGNIKVVRAPETPGGATGKELPIYLQDGLAQNFMTPEGEARDHTVVLARLAAAYGSGARRALVLGLGAGLLPRYLEQQGLKVAAVEIDANSLKAASEFFGFDPQKIDCYLEDARTFVRRHHHSYDLVIVDLFHGDSTPDYLLTVEFFRQVRACLRPGGLVLMNTYFDPANEPPNRTLLATVAAAFPHVLELRSADIKDLVGNLYLVTADRPLDPEAARELADREADSLAPDDYQTLKSARKLEARDLNNATPVSDDHNIFSVLFAGSQLRYRSRFNRLLFHLLVN